MEGPFPPTIQTALDEAYMSDALAPLLQERHGRNIQLQSLKIDHFQRRLVRYVTTIFDPETAETIEQVVMGKVYKTPDSMENSFNIMRQLWVNGFSRETDDGVTIPEPLGCLPGPCILLMEEVGGVPLRRLVKRMVATPDQMRLFAGAAVKLHRCPITLGQPDTVLDRLSRFDPTPETLAEAYPSLADSVSYIVSSVRAIHAGSGDNIYCLTHGDFHLGQMHMKNDKAWLLDLDPVKYADPARDLAQVFVYFKRMARRERKVAYINTLGEAFLLEYFSLMDWEIARRIPLYEALLHLKRACKCLRVQDSPGWEKKIVSLVEQAEACTRAMESTNGKLDLDKFMELYHRCPGTV